MSDDQAQFDKGDAGAAGTTPTQAGSIKKGGHVMIKGFPCKVTQYSTAKPGKHGSAKATIVGIDIFTNKKYEDTCPTSATVYVPDVTKVDMEVADIDQDGFISLIKTDGDLKTDLKLPQEDQQIYNDLKKVWEGRGDNTVLFTIQSACGKQKAIAGRTKQ